MPESHQRIAGYRYINSFISSKYPDSFISLILVAYFKHVRNIHNSCSIYNYLQHHYNKLLKPRSVWMVNGTGSNSVVVINSCKDGSCLVLENPITYFVTSSSISPVTCRENSSYTVRRIAQIPITIHYCNIYGYVNM